MSGSVLTPLDTPDSGLLDVPCDLIVGDLQMIINEVTPRSLRIVPSVRRMECGLKELAINFSVQHICLPHPHSPTMAEGLKGPHLCLLSKTTRILNICTVETWNGCQFDHLVIRALSLHHHCTPRLVVDELQGCNYVLPLWGLIWTVISIVHCILWIASEWLLCLNYRVIIIVYIYIYIYI
jgi:hypothetical protein